MSNESITEHLKRRAAVLAERVELELSVAGTEFAGLERAVFKATKNNTKIPKEKHIIALHRAIADGDSGKTVLKMLIRRLKEVGQERISSGSFAGGLKTLAVWHRCLNSGDNSFLNLCSQYVHVLEPPAQNPLALMYGSYIRELLQTFSKCKHPYQRETDYEESRIATLSQGDLVAHVPPLLKQLTKLLECDLQGGLMDTKTRCSVQYVINLLILDAIPLFKAADLAMDRVREVVGGMSGEDAERMAAMYGRFVKMPDRLLILLKQANTERDVSVPLTSFDTKALRAFKGRLEAAQAKLRREGCDYETVKALAEVAAHRAHEDEDGLPMRAVATFSLDELDEEAPHPAPARPPPAPAPDLLGLSLPAGPPPPKPPPPTVAAAASGAWDPFADAGPSGVDLVSHNPFAAPAATVAAAGGAGGGSLLDWDTPGAGKANPLDAFLSSGPAKPTGGGFGGGAATMPAMGGAMGAGGLGFGGMGGGMGSGAMGGGLGGGMMGAQSMMGGMGGGMGAQSMMGGGMGGNMGGGMGAQSMMGGMGGGMGAQSMMGGGMGGGMGAQSMMGGGGMGGGGMGMMGGASRGTGGAQTMSGMGGGGFMGAQSMMAGGMGGMGGGAGKGAQSMMGGLGGMGNGSAATQQAMGGSGQFFGGGGMMGGGMQGGAQTMGNMAGGGGGIMGAQPVANMGLGGGGMRSGMGAAQTLGAKPAAGGPGKTVDLLGGLDSNPFA